MAAKKWVIIRRQRRVVGGRAQLPSCVLREIRARVEAEAQRHGVSKSFVVSVALAHAFGVKDQEEY